VWTDATVVRTAREERVSNLEGRSEKRKKKKKEDQSVRKGRKVVKHCVFSNVLWGSLKRRVRSYLVG
jgi:hypothetical protein